MADLLSPTLRDPKLPDRERPLPRRAPGARHTVMNRTIPRQVTVPPMVLS
jgi:hypothetical protein